MKSEHHLNSEVIDGEVTGCAALPGQIKLRYNPYLFIAVPCGVKDDPIIVTCPGCKNTYSLEGRSAFATTPIPWQVAFKSMQIPLNITSTLVWQSGSLSAVARQMMTKRALRDGAELILYWDDDIIPPIHAVRQMITFLKQNPRAGAVSGVCPTKSDPVETYIFRNHGEGCTYDMEMGPGARPEPVFASGGGFLMARAEAIRAGIELLKSENDGKEIPIWTDEVEIHHDPESSKKMEVLWGHDMRFCNTLNRAGWPVFVDGSILCGHYDIQTGKTYTIPETFPGFAKAIERQEREYAENQKQTAGRLPFVQVVPTDDGAAGEAEVGAPLGSGEGNRQEKSA